MNGTEITTAEAQQEENQGKQQNGRFQAMNTRFETMEKHIKSLTAVVGSWVDNNKLSTMTRIKRGKKRPEHMLSTKIFPSYQRDMR